MNDIGLRRSLHQALAEVEKRNNYAEFYSWLQQKAKATPESLTGRCGDIWGCIVAEYFKQHLSTDIVLFVGPSNYVPNVQGPQVVLFSYASPKQVALQPDLQEVIRVFDKEDELEEETDYAFRWTYAGFLAALTPPATEQETTHATK